LAFVSVVAGPPNAARPRSLRLLAGKYLELKMILASSPGCVLVTGGTGYIAKFCIAQLLQEGWRVRTTVRSLARAEQVRTNIAKISDGIDTIEFFEADLTADRGWDRAVAGADYVLHVASPMPRVSPKTDDELIRPARDGALRVLKAARDASVKRVVLTSSIAAIIHGHGTHPTLFTESDWTDETDLVDTGPYERSKTIAERAAWAWQADQGTALELVTINPSVVIGPVLSPDFSFSIEVVKKLLDGSVPGIPRFGFDLVDVRDIARLHILAMTTSSATGNRFIGAGEFLWAQEIASILKQGLAEKARKVPSMVVPDFLVRIFGLFDSAVRSQLFNLGKEKRVSSDKARKMLGWTTRPVSEGILDTARSLQAIGLV
jgi:dihydroflavonol-4-reductase